MTGIDILSFRHYLLHSLHLGCPFPNTEMEEGPTSTALVPFSYSSPFVDVLQAESRMFTFFSKTVVMQQQWESGGQGGTSIGFGASVYNCSIVLAYYIESIALQVSKGKRNVLLLHRIFSTWQNATIASYLLVCVVLVQFLGKRVVEIGCGPGLCSVAAALAGAADVMATDGDHKSVALASLNLSKNCSEEIISPDRCRSRKLFWGDADDIQGVKSSWKSVMEADQSSRGEHVAATSSQVADFIIASDVAGCPYVSAYASLCDTLVALSGPRTVVLLACQKRHSSEEAFHEMLRDKFAVERLVAWGVHSFFICHTISYYVQMYVTHSLLRCSHSLSLTW